MEKIINIQVPEGYEIDKEKSTFEKIVFKEIDKLPRKWEDLKEIKGYYIDSYSTIYSSFGNCLCVDKNRNVFPTKEYAEAALALAQLLQLRQAWTGEWKPDFRHENCKNPNYVVQVYNYEIYVEQVYSMNAPMSFPTKQMATDFLNTFSTLLETAKPLL